MAYYTQPTDKYDKEKNIPVGKWAKVSLLTLDL